MMTHVVMLCKVESSLKGFLSVRIDNKSIRVSFRSLSILADVASLCWSLVLYDTEENSDFLHDIVDPKVGRV